MKYSRIAVYCGSGTGRNPAFVHAAQSLGTLLAKRAIELVYGGGGIGLMNVVSDAVLQSGGTAIGVIPKFLFQRGLAHPGVTELRVVETMHERKETMASLADAFIALPGGYGTLEEILEIATWNQLALQRKPYGILNVDGYYDPLLAQLDRAVEEELLQASQRRQLLCETTPERLLERMDA